MDGWAGKAGTGGRADAARPRHPDLHLIDSRPGGGPAGGDDGLHLFLPDGSRLYDIDAATAAEFQAALAADDGDRDAEVRRLLDAYGLSAPPRIDDTPVADPPVRSLSLAVAQTCNLGCAYCYARGGDFGGPAKAMPLETALPAVDFLLAGTAPGDRVNLAFLGGEPLAARAVLHACTRHAAERAAARGVTIGFSVTSNGTLISEDDAALFEAFGFAVTISLDGTRAAHDRLRPFKNGSGSFDRIMERVVPLLARQGQAGNRMQVSARITVTPRNLDLPGTLDAFVDAGFHSVGFSPMLAAPDPAEEMGPADLEVMLDGMIACADRFEEQASAGRRYPFSNLVTALKEIHRGTHRPYPCGAGAGYLGVSADGDLGACHRFVGDAAGAMGSLSAGIERDGRNRWLAERHVHRQQPCAGCWARYLCGGGCHHEVIHRGRPACGFIRGWLHHCLAVYGRLGHRVPALFGGESFDGG